MDESEPLIPGLEPIPAEAFEAADPPQALKAALLRRTSRAVRGRPRRRMLLAGMAVTAAVAVAFAGGMAAGRLGESRTRAEIGEPRGPRSGGVPGETPGEAPASPAPTAPPGDPRDILALVGEARPADRARLLRLAGDRFLAASGDVPRALDCYRQYLEIAPERAEPPLEPGDTWLLAALKGGRSSFTK